MKYSYDGSSLKTGKTELTPPTRSSGQPAPVVKSRRRWVSGAVAWFCLCLAVAAVRLYIDWRDGAKQSGDAEAEALPDAKPVAAGEAGVRGQEKDRARPSVTVEDAKNFLTPSDAEIEQLYAYVVKSPAVAGNIQYREMMDGMPLDYIATNDAVNAFAGRRDSIGTNGTVRIGLKMTVFGGMARYARLVGLAAAQENAGGEPALKRLVETMPRTIYSHCSEEEAIKAIERNSLVATLADPAARQKAVSYSSGMLISVLAHETGHLVLGHLLSNGSAKTNLEISRNHEREADSFASSVISASPFGEYIFAGTLFMHYALAMQGDGYSDAGRSHPLSRERLENFVRANRDKAAAMGVSCEALRDASGAN